MALHIQDKETDRLVREFARRRGVGLTEAVKIAVREANDKESDSAADLMKRIHPVLERARAMKKRSGIPADRQVNDKPFMDEMWGEPD